MFGEFGFVLSVSQHFPVLVLTTEAVRRSSFGSSVMDHYCKEGPYRTEFIIYMLILF